MEDLATMEALLKMAVTNTNDIKDICEIVDKNADALIDAKNVVNLNADILNNAIKSINRVSRRQKQLALVGAVIAGGIVYGGYKLHERIKKLEDTPYMRSRFIRRIDNENDRFSE